MAEMTPERVFQMLAAPSGRRQKTPCVVLAGEDAYLRDISRKGIVAACFPEGAPEWAVVRASLREEGLEHILSMAQSYPMLAPRQSPHLAHVVRIPLSLLAGQLTSSAKRKLEPAGATRNVRQPRPPEPAPALPGHS